MSLDEAEDKLRAIKEGGEQFRSHVQANECPGCGSFRLDGRPPLLHQHGCPYEADAPLMYLPDGTPLHRSDTTEGER
jgi:hypothetical protein